MEEVKILVTRTKYKDDDYMFGYENLETGGSLASNDVTDILGCVIERLRKGVTNKAETFED